MSEVSACGRCHRPLKNPIYRKIGMGKICLMKSNVPNKLELIQQMNDMLHKKKIQYQKIDEIPYPSKS